MARTTISVEGEIFEGGKRRQKALRYKTFSQYVEYLIEKDTRERPDHVQVREESSKYQHKSKHHSSAAAA